MGLQSLNRVIVSPKPCMLTDIFSSFDPARSRCFSIFPSVVFWSLRGLNFILVGGRFWLSPGRVNWVFFNVVGGMAEQIGRTLGTHLKGLTRIVVPLFLIIILINLSGLLPYVFRVSRHLIYTLSFGFVIWVSLIISRVFRHPYRFVAGLLPRGAPDWLNPFLAILEVLSLMARPITLSFRLAANISAGHIILSLIGLYRVGAVFSSVTRTVVLFRVLIFYVIFEIGICLVQAYIFCLLASLYRDNHPSH